MCSPQNIRPDVKRSLRHIPRDAIPWLWDAGRLTAARPFVFVPRRPLRRMKLRSKVHSKRGNCRPETFGVFPLIRTPDPDIPPVSPAPSQFWAGVLVPEPSSLKTVSEDGELWVCLFETRQAVGGPPYREGHGLSRGLGLTPMLAWHIVRWNQ